MSTIGYTSWAVDLANVAAIYPLQGFEVLMVILGIVFWIGWHVLQIRAENREFEEAEKAKGDVKASIDRY